MYLTWANPLFLAFFAFNEINKLRVFNRAQNSDSSAFIFEKRYVLEVYVGGCYLTDGLGSYFRPL